MSEKKRMMHVGITAGEIGGYVLLPSSPERAEMLSHSLENVREVACFREYRTFTGTLEGETVSVTSTGMGGPSMAIAVEELHECGAHTLIRVGTCESTSEKVHPGQLVLPNGAVRMEGVAGHYSPTEYPAVPDSDVLLSLDEAAESLGIPYHVGVNITKAVYSTQYSAQGRPMGWEIGKRWEAYEQGGALSADMGCAPLFAAAGSLGMRSAAVLAVTAEKGCQLLYQSQWPRESEELVCRAAVEGLRKLILRDRADR